MIYIDSQTVDPYWNLALEQHLFQTVGQHKDCFLLWQNEKSVIVGKHQNTIEEINGSFIEKHRIPVVRRLSGGGAVYHDLGNLNFTFITNKNYLNQLHMQAFCAPVIDTLKQLGITAQISGRNDLTIQGKKFSGNSQYIEGTRLLHHGTLMFSSDLGMLERALNVSGDKITSKGIQSVRSRVTNIQEHLPHPVCMEEFKNRLKENVLNTLEWEPHVLSGQDLTEIDQLAKQRYRTWEWNYGESPACTIRKKRYFEGCGTIEVRLGIQNGRISAIKFYGDFLGAKSPDDLSAFFLGYPYDSRVIQTVLQRVSISEYFYHLKPKDLFALIF